MHIVHITTALGNGGAEAAMYRLICSNQQNTHVVICLTHSDKYESLLRDVGVDVYTLDMKDRLVPIQPLVKLYKLLKQEKPDVVQTWMYHANFFGGLVAKLCGVPKIFWGIRMSDPKAGQIGKLTQAINWTCGKLGNAIPTKIVSCAHRATQEHIKLGYPPNKMVTICNGYDTDILCFDQSERDRIRESHGLTSDTLLIGTVARWHPQKDHRTLFRAIAESKNLESMDWKLMLIGLDMDASNNDLLQVITEFNLQEKCILVGTQKNIPAIQSALDIHVLSSSDEGFPNVIAEAMACGTPCVSTDAGDASYIIDDTGWISPIKNWSDLSINIDDAVEHFQQAPEWNDRKEQCVKRIKNQFSIQRMSNEFSSTWNAHNGTVS